MSRGRVTRASHSRRAWRAVVGFAVLLVVAGATGAVCAATATDTAPAGAGLGGFTIEARAPGYETTFDEPAAPTHPEGQGTVPHTLAQLKTGPVAFAQAAIAWPGTLLGNLGETIVASGGSNLPTPVKGNTKTLNDPVRAESRIGDPSPDNSYSGAPGTTMTTHADGERVQADANVKSLATPTGSAGGAVSQSKSTLSGNIGVAHATSTVSNVVLGPANVIAIDSVVSTATASTDGNTAKASGSTKVNGFKVLGQNATVDENGVQFGQTKNPIQQQLNKNAAAALDKSHFKIVLTKPDGTPDGAGVTYNAGALVMTWEPQPGVVFSVTLGGATVIVNSSAGFDSGSTDAPVATPSAPDTGAGGSGPSSAGGSTGGATSGGGGAATDAGSVPAVAPPTKPASFFVGAPVGWIVLGAMGALLAAFGLRKLSTDVLAEQAAVCSLERTSP